MEGISLWADDIRLSAALILARVIEYLPSLLGALLLLIIGWLVARLLRAGGVRAARWFNVLLQTRLGAERAQHFALSNTGVRLLGDITFWVVVLAVRHGLNPCPGAGHFHILAGSDHRVPADAVRRRADHAGRLHRQHDRPRPDHGDCPFDGHSPCRAVRAVRSDPGPGHRDGSGHQPDRHRCHAARRLDRYRRGGRPPGPWRWRSRWGRRVWSAI